MTRRTTSLAGVADKAAACTISLRIPADEIAALDAWRDDMDEVLPRPEAIRRIVAEWLRQNGYMKNTGAGYLRPEELSSENDD